MCLSTRKYNANLCVCVGALCVGGGCLSTICWTTLTCSVCHGIWIVDASISTRNYSRSRKNDIELVGVRTDVVIVSFVQRPESSDVVFLFSLVHIFLFSFRFIRFSLYWFRLFFFSFCELPFLLVFYLFRFDARRLKTRKTKMNCKNHIDRERGVQPFSELETNLGEARVCVVVLAHQWENGKTTEKETRHS